MSTGSQPQGSKAFETLLARYGLDIDQYSELMRASSRMDQSEVAIAVASMHSAFAELDNRQAATSLPISALRLKHEPSALLSFALKAAEYGLGEHNLTAVFLDYKTYLHYRDQVNCAEPRLLPALTIAGGRANNRNTIGLRIHDSANRTHGLLLARIFKLEGCTFQHALDIDNCDADPDRSNYSFSDDALALSNSWAGDVALIGDAWVNDAAGERSAQICMLYAMYAAALGTWGVSDVCSFFKIRKNSSVEVRLPFEAADIPTVTIRSDDGPDVTSEMRSLSARQILDEYRSLRDRAENSAAPSHANAHASMTMLGNASY